jgi:hypothetical protein
MEGLIKRFYILGAVFVVAGLSTLAIPNPEREVKSEEWMIENSVSTMPEYVLERGNEPEEITYRMDAMTYSELRPYGIVARVFSGPDNQFDVVLIASSDKASFHDPRVCFTAQRFIIESEQTEIVRTQHRGDIPITLAEMKNPRGNRQLAAYFYRGPNGFYASPLGVKKDLFMQQFRRAKDMDGVFYRIIPYQETTTKQELLDFIAKYMDESYDVSGGYF